MTDDDTPIKRDSLKQFFCVFLFLKKKQLLFISDNPEKIIQLSKYLINTDFATKRDKIFD